MHIKIKLKINKKEDQDQGTSLQQHWTIIRTNIGNSLETLWTFIGKISGQTLEHHWNNIGKSLEHHWNIIGNSMDNHLNDNCNIIGTTPDLVRSSTHLLTLMYTQTAHTHASHLPEIKKRTKQT